MMSAIMNKPMVPTTVGVFAPAIAQLPVAIDYPAALALRQMALVHGVSLENGKYPTLSLFFELT